MAADRPLAERGFVEVKMGRSKFPGKPSKIGNRKRVNLSSCALPEENDSSKAAKNIYLGLSVFNETFGDNEMVAPGPFHGFSLAEVEDAMAEARLQQNEAELEHKKQGINVNFWDTFQTELFSIMSCSSYDKANNHQVDKTKLSFDGGGSAVNEELNENSSENSEKQPSKASVVKNNKSVKNVKIKNNTHTPLRKSSKMIKFHSPRLKLSKLPCSPGSSKSLQSQAAKRLLEKAKMSNASESNKSSSTEKKFILPNYSIHSSRVIKPNKKFLEESSNKRKLLRNRTVNGASDRKKPKVSSVEEVRTGSSDKKHTDEEKTESENEESQKRGSRTENSVSENKNSNSVKNSSQTMSSTGKIILREARLQLDNSNSSLLEGPFSSPSACSLSPNSHLKISTVQSVTAPGSEMCGVCGIVRFYRFVDLAKKFGIYCCDSCRKFISKIIKSYSLDKNLKLQCVKGTNLCGILPSVKGQHLNTGTCLTNTRCQACWLKLCLKNFKMPIKLKQKLLKLLPVNMQLGMSLELNQKLSINDDINSRFRMGYNTKDFKWWKENCNSASPIKFTANEKQLNWPNSLDSVAVNEKSLRKRNRCGSENASKLLPQNGKNKTETNEKNRQSIVLKGPRVKHVCRSASVALGQPLATFPSEVSPTKKVANESANDCKNCDTLTTTTTTTAAATTTNNDVETQGVVEKPDKEIPPPEGRQEKKSSNVSKQVSNTKANSGAQQNGGTKSKKKTNSKTENPVSMDFWECYDPDEVCETGFGLIGSESFSVRALCFLCGSSGQEKFIHCASCCEPYHEFCVNEGQLKLQDGTWKYDWVCPRCTVCFTCGRTSGQQLKCIKCDNSYHTECVDRVGGRLLYSPDRPWVCSICLRCKSCSGVDVSVFVGNLPLCKGCFILRQKGNYCPLCQRCYEDDDYESKMMECGQCKCWVHAKCEGLSEEKYQVLSFLPESVEYICRMCCVMPPAPWWIAVEAELKSGYLGVLKALSKNRKACTMLKWSPRKQCTCRNVNSITRTLDFEDTKSAKVVNDCSKGESSSVPTKEDGKFQDNLSDNKVREEKYQPGNVSERKTSIEVISHPTESLKLTLKIMKGSETDDKEKSESSSVNEETTQVKQINKENTVRVKKCLSNEENSEDSLINTFDCPDESQISLQSLFKGNDFGGSASELPDKRLLSSPLNPPSDSGIGSTDDELKANCLTDEESCKLDDQQPSTNRIVGKPNCDSSVSFLEEKRECFCFLEVDSYNSRSKPFSPNLMSIKKKVTTSEYTSLHQFHQDMQGMIATTQSVELMDLYHQTIKEIFPWFDPKYSRVQSNSQKVSGTTSLESTPVKSTPTKSSLLEACKVPKEKLVGQCLNYFYSDYVVEDSRICLMCKTVGDGPPGDTGRLLYCGQNEWVHCNCALWSGEVFEEIDGSLQNVHSAISRGRSIRCPECNLKGASIGCCARNCQETYHFRCARQIGCVFMDDKTVYCPSHVKDSAGKLVQNEKEFEIRRPVYVELDKRKMKTVDSSQIRFAVGALHVNNLGKFVLKLSDQPEAIIPEQFDCTRLFWSCYEPWRIVRYHFTVRLLDVEDDAGIDCGINFTIDHSKDPEFIELKLKQLKYFQDHNAFLDISDKLPEGSLKEKRRLPDARTGEEILKSRSEEGIKLLTPIKRPKKDHKVVKKIFDHFDSKDDENCLSDNQNTADLLPPDLEEAIFKDLPNDILDGISMQDIFMDIKNDPYDGNAKEGIPEDGGESEDISESLPNKSRKQDFHPEATSQLEFWVDANDCRQDSVEEAFSKSTRDLRKSKYETLSSQSFKKTGTLRTYQKSCGYNWNCKTEGPNNKWKKNPKCHVTVNLLESQERGNMLQELKFTDGLVTVSTGAIDSVKDLKARLEDTKCSIQQEEGKENKCLPWHTRLQPRLLQVDGGIDSSSSGSEAGESPQRLMDENINSKIVPLPQSSPYFDSLDYSINSPIHSVPNSFVPTPENFYPSSYSVENQSATGLINNLPQLDGVNDGSDASDSEDSFVKTVILSKRPRREHENSCYTRKLTYRISQCDGGVDSESDDGEFSKNSSNDGLPGPLEMPQTKDEPVKCKQCHCTYRTKISYQRHLETCCGDFIFSSSDGEMSEEESPKKQSGGDYSDIKTDVENDSLSSTVEKMPGETPEKETKKDEENTSAIGQTARSSASTLDQTAEKDLKKETPVKRTYSQIKPSSGTKKPAVVNSAPQVQQILVQQPNVPPTLIVRDIPAPNIVPATFTDAGPTIGYVTAIDSQNPYAKPQLIATPNGIISGGFQYPSAPAETQIVGGLCLNPQTMQANIPGIIIQQHHPTGPVISSQPGPMLMSNEQMMMAPTGLFDVIQDPGTGGMYLASHSQPVLYNMETIVSNTVMQTNQFVSNVLGTSFSQTSTQIFEAQAAQMEQQVNFPPNYIVLAPNPPTADKILPSDALICVQAPQPLIQNQTPIQIPSQPIYNASFPTPQTINTEPKIISTQLSPIRCLQPLQVKQFCSSIVVNKIPNASAQMISQSVPQVFRGPETNPRPDFQKTDIKPKPMVSQVNSPFRSVPMMRPNVSKCSPKGYEKAVLAPKSKTPVQPRSRALVDYINNFNSDSCDAFPVKDSPSEKVMVQNQPSGDSVKSKLVENAAPGLVNIKHEPEPVVPSVISNVSSQFFGNTYSSKARSKTAVKLPEKTAPAAAPIIAPPEKDNIQNNGSISSSVTCNKASVHVEKEKDKSPERLSETQHVESIKSEKVEAPTKVLSNISNSFSLDRETNSSLSLPCLDDFYPTGQEDQQTVNPPAETLPEVGSGKQAGDILPLQDGSQSLNTGCKPSSKSPQKSPPVKNKTPPSDEKTKQQQQQQKKKKSTSVSSDENSLESILLPENEPKRSESSAKKVSGRMFPTKCEEKGPKLIFDVISDDGFKSSSTSMVELWANICSSVQEMRAVLKIPPLPVPKKGHEILGMQNHGLQHCLEQLKGVEQCVKYKCKYFVRDVQKGEEDERTAEKENLSGCARTEKFTTRREYDMFAWLASRHRQLPKLTESAEETLSSIRRANSLPMAMRYRNLKETAKLYVGVYRSKIHGRGLFCLREIEAGEMVIEYAGEVIRSNLTDKREKYYTEKGIGCYMFRIDDHFVVDATMKGNAARFINHSCEPNCYSRVVDILGKKHIVIFALRRINVMEELTYDYKFPFEDEKISCHCLSKKCRKYLN